MVKILIGLIFCRIKVNIFVKKDLYRPRVGSAALGNGGKLVVAQHIHHLHLPLRLRDCSVASSQEQALNEHDRARGTEKSPSTTEGLRNETATAVSKVSQFHNISLWQSLHPAPQSSGTNQVWSMSVGVLPLLSLLPQADLLFQC